MSELQTLVATSPVIIEYKAKANMVNSNAYGTYLGLLWRSIPYIELQEDLLFHIKIACLSHEIGHALCEQKDCDCWKEYKKNKKAKVEIHAYKYQLKELLKNKNKPALLWSINHIKNLLYRKDEYEKAAKHIMKLKLWQKCLDYIGENNETNTI